MSDFITLLQETNWQRVLMLLQAATIETVYMVFASGLITFILGIPLGVILHTTKKGNLLSNPIVNNLLSTIVNIGRSVPFLVLMVAVMSLTRFLIGTSIGTTATIIPLTVGAVPFVARLIENSLAEVPSSLVEASQSMGATPLQIVCKVLLPEALPSIINCITITLVTLVNYSAMAGIIGGGGLGDLAVRYGYQRNDTVVMIITVIVLVILVQLIQMVGDKIAQAMDHR